MWIRIFRFAWKSVLADPEDEEEILEWMEELGIAWEDIESSL